MALQIENGMMGCDHLALLMTLWDGDSTYRSCAYAYQFQVASGLREQRDRSLPTLLNKSINVHPRLSSRQYFLQLYPYQDCH